MSSFIFNFLPSFYRDFMVDENGSNILLPLFEQYANAMGDAVYQAEQIANAPYLEKCPLFIKEYYKTINIRSSNSYGTNSYIIESDIIAFDQLYYDAAFTIPVPLSGGELQHNPYVIHDIVNNVRYIEFDGPLNPIANTLYCKFCLKDKNILQNIFGNQLDYKPLIPELYHSDIKYNYTINYDTYVAELELYRSQLIALTNCLVHGPVYENVNNSLGMFLGLKYAPFDAIVKEIDYSYIILENLSTGENVTLYPVNYMNSDFIVGTIVTKYTVLEHLPFMLYDMYSDPARFTQSLLYNYSAELLELLDIDTANSENYATLSYDSVLNFDDNNIYFDMGNNTGVSHDVPGDATYYPFPTTYVIDKFDDYVDSRFSNQKIYEMFRNVFIIYLTSYAYVDDVTYFINRVKAKFTKCVIMVHEGS